GRGGGPAWGGAPLLGGGRGGAPLPPARGVKRRRGRRGGGRGVGEAPSPPARGGKGRFHGGEKRSRLGRGSA
ncbi:unnamed protein product, partial [Bubo scandiacus]